MIRRSLSLSALLFACASPTPTIVDDKDSGLPSDDLGEVGLPGRDGGPVRCTAGQILCSGNTQYTCDSAGMAVGQMDCRAGTTCFTSIGCRVCMPGLSRCSPTTGMESQTQTCAMDGSGWSNGPVCNAGEGLTCVGGRCVSPVSYTHLTLPTSDLV